MTDEAKLKILIEAQNRAKGAFDEANGQLEKTQSRFDGINEKLDRIGGKMKNVGGKMTVGVTLPVLAGAGLSVKAFSDLQETINKVDVSFGNSSGTVKTWAQDSIKSMGLARQSALDAAALFGDMGTGMGQTQQEASKMSMGLTQLGADMASFKNVSFERAQTALAGVYTGETEALKGLGIVMTQTNLEEFARAKGINKSMKEMTQAELVQLRYNYVMDKTKNAQGDFARTSDGLANKTRMSGERMKELSAQIGEKLAPFMNKLLETGNKVLDFFNRLSSSQQNAILIIIAVVAAIGPLLLVIGNLITVVKGLAAAFSFLAANPIILAITAIILVIAGLAYLIIKNWDTIKAFFIGLWNTVKSAFDSFVKWVVGVFGPVIDGIKKAWEGVVNFFVGLWEGIKGVFNAIVGFFQKWGLTILAVIFWPFSLAVGLIIANWETIKGFFAGVWAFIVAVFTPVISFFSAMFSGAWNIIKSIWSGVVAYFTFIWNGIVAVFSAVIGFYSRIFTTAWNIIKGVWSVVSGWFASVWQGIVNVFSPVVNFFSRVFSSAWQAIRNVFSAVGGFFRGVWNSIVSIFSNVGTSVGNAIGSAFKNVVRSVLSGAVNIINGVIGAINGAIGTINKIPGVNIPKMGTLSVPSFYTGVRNFGGGLATVGDVRGQGGELVSLPRGTDVYSNRETKRILGALADGEGIGGGMTFNNYGTIVNETPEASQAFWDRFNRVSELATQGVPTNG
jgi:phage-related protein